MSTVDPHPYFPPGIALSGGVYVENDWGVCTLLAVFSAMVVALMAVTLLVVQAVNPKLSQGDKGLVVWFTLCGCIHVFFEGYFLLHHQHLASLNTLPAQLWKEYALADSRYLTSSPLVLCMETSTLLLWGPLSFLTAGLIVARSPYRHPVQALVSTGQCYGCALYYASSLLEHALGGHAHGRPEPLYFWGYFVGTNSAWMIVPATCVWKSLWETGRAFSRAAERDGRKKSL